MSKEHRPKKYELSVLNGIGFIAYFLYKQGPNRIRIDNDVPLPLTDLRGHLQLQAQILPTPTQAELL